MSREAQLGLRNQQMIRKLMGCVALVVGVAIAGCGASANRSYPAPSRIMFPYEWLGNIDKDSFNEPSGAVYHSGRGTVFVVGDEGDICEITTAGVLVKKKLSDRQGRRPDYEGVTYDPSTGLLYVAIEGQETILEINPETFETTRSFPIERAFNGKLLMKKGGQGIEAITFVPNSKHPEGGTFYVANQSFSLDNQDDISAIFEVELPLRTAGLHDPKGKILRYFSLGVIDLSGLHYDKLKERLYVISDATNTFWEVTKEGKIFRGYAFPGQNQEGLAVDAEGHVYIAQDSGGIIKIKWLRE